jgi:hypothetical protein
MSARFLRPETAIPDAYDTSRRSTARSVRRTPATRPVYPFLPMPSTPFPGRSGSHHRQAHLIELARIGFAKKPTDAAVGADKREPEQSRPMGEARDPRADDSTLIPPDGSATERIAIDSASPATEADAPHLAPTLSLNPGERGPAVAETLVAPSLSVDETLNAPSSVDSKREREKGTNEKRRHNE